MIENPIERYGKCAEYAVDNKYTPLTYGVMFLLKPDAPKNIMEIYKE